MEVMKFKSKRQAENYIDGLSEKNLLTIRSEGREKYYFIFQFRFGDPVLILCENNEWKTEGGE